MSAHARSLRLFTLGCFFILFLSGSLAVFDKLIEARNMRTISDTLSTSAPAKFSDHRVEFKVDTALPPGGFITVRPQDGAFTIPTSTFSFRNVDLYVSNGGGYVLRSATATPDATYDGVAITGGTSGEVTITLNSTAGISSGSDVRIVIGASASQASSTADTGWLNPTLPGTYSVDVEAGGIESANARTLIAIIDEVNVGPADTREFLAPVIFNGAPTGNLIFSTAAVEMTVETDELADCRYSTTPGIAYASMVEDFTSTGLVVHLQEITGLTVDTTYNFYIRCMDDEGNFNTSDYILTFAISPMPTGNPTSGTSTQSGAGTGTGTGSSGTGSGSSSGGGSGGGSGGSGAGGGGSTATGGTTPGGGGFESAPKPFASGDAQVIISGYAFPGSTVTALVDGFPAETARASNQGQFTITIESIAKGVYTFGVYATDSNNIKSSTFSTSFSVIGARTSNLSNIHIMPTIRVNPNPVEPGTSIALSGQAIQNSVVSIEMQPEKSSAGRRTFTANSDSQGRWSLNVDTTGFSRDTWKVRAKSSNESSGIASQFSNYTFFGVGVTATTMSSDLNRDGKVNLVDFSILLFHWNTNGGTSNPPADINRDGKVTLTDFSIMIFNWTG